MINLEKKITLLIVHLLIPQTTSEYQKNDLIFKEDNSVRRAMMAEESTLIVYLSNLNICNLQSN